ncbi:MAG: membrane protein insertion efficiency factor YidD [Candidatus Tantalella remota]|nr:membrane protein insertion efficiency factor YidD [Candidatus Tantalella remota]
MKKAIIWLLKGYRKAISPLFIKSCRFHPTCSEYAMTAVEKHGVFKGALLAGWRILRCNPFSRGGYEPVPEQKKVFRKRSGVKREAKITAQKERQI